MVKHDSVAGNGLRMLMSMLLICNSIAGAAFADTKKDITDPVLQEILASFSTRMPRFIDKHGSNVFVADEAVTRSGLMLALYEYDRSLKIPRKEYVTRQEFEDWKKTISLPEKERQASGQYDITQIINDLLPNMHILLDNSLEDSKVFSKLKEQVQKGRSSGGSISASDSASGQKVITRQEFDAVRNRLSLLEKDMETITEEPGNKTSVAEVVSKQDFDTIRNRVSLLEKDRTRYAEKSSGRDEAQSSPSSKRELEVLVNRLSLLEKNVSEHEEKNASVLGNAWSDIHQSQRDIASLARRMDDVDNRQANVVQHSEQKQGTTRQAREDTSETRREIARLTKRLDALETNAQQNSGTVSDGAAGYASALTKVTLGLGMVAAFFMAR